jgi:hypothetical protein
VKRTTGLLIACLAAACAKDEAARVALSPADFGPASGLAPRDAGVDDLPNAMEIESRTLAARDAQGTRAEGEVIESVAVKDDAGNIVKESIGGARAESVVVGQRWVVDGLVGQVNGRPIFASEFLAPLEDRLLRTVAEMPREPAAKEISRIVAERFDQLINNELVIAEAEAGLTPEMQQGLFAFLKDMREKTVAELGGSNASATNALMEELGIGLDEFMSRRRDEILAGELLRGRVDKRIIVSWRDVEREYAKNVERFAAQSRTIVGRLALRTGDAEKLTKAREAFAAGKPFAEVAKELGVKDDGAWRDFPVADISATDLNDDLKALLKDLPIGKASNEVTKGDSVTWYAIMARDSRPAASIYDPGVQLMLRAEIAGRRRMVEQSRYLKGLRDRWVAADIDQMRVRLQSIAVQRYVPGA